MLVNVFLVVKQMRLLMDMYVLNVIKNNIFFYKIIKNLLFSTGSSTMTGCNACNSTSSC